MSQHNDDSISLRSREILARVQHDIRTPINAIIGYSEMLVESPEVQRIQDLAELLISVRNIGHSLHVTVNTILTNQNFSGDDKMNINEVLVKLQAELKTYIEQQSDKVLKMLKPWVESAEMLKKSDLVKDLKAINLAVYSLLFLIEYLPNVAHPNNHNTSPAIFKSLRLLRIMASKTEKLQTGPQITGSILVVEDLKHEREMISRRLTTAGHEVTAIANGQQALQLLAAQKFDLVLLDLMMPEVNGIEVLLHMRSGEHRDVPVVIISSQLDREIAAECVAAGANDYLPKPINPVFLVSRARLFIEMHQMRSKLEKLEGDLENSNVTKKTAAS